MSTGLAQPHLPPSFPDLTRRLEAASISATEAKNEFSRLIERVIQGERVVITKHDVPKAVLLSIAEYTALAGSTLVKLNTLDQEFDDLLASMQTKVARAAVKAAFNATPKQLGKAAVAAARKRGR